MDHAVSIEQAIDGYENDLKAINLKVTLLSMNTQHRISQTLDSRESRAGVP